MKYSLIVCCTLLLFSCNQHHKPVETQHKTTVTETPVTTAVTGKFPDPVCQMPFDTSYKEWTVYNQDTFYFCSATCKRVFTKAPEKFVAQLKK